MIENEKGYDSMTPPKKTEIKDVPTRIFEAFVQALESSGVSVDLRDRLRKALLEERRYSEAALRSALKIDEGTE